MLTNQTYAGKKSSKHRLTLSVAGDVKRKLLLAHSSENSWAFIGKIMTSVPFSKTGFAENLFQQ
jgi:hypothetical protein